MFSEEKDASNDCRIADGIEHSVAMLLLPHFGVAVVVAAAVAELVVESAIGEMGDETPQRLVLALQNPTTESFVGSQLISGEEDLCRLNNRRVS